MSLSLGLGLSLRSGAVASGFSPTSIPGCILWLRADLGVTLTGSLVTGWEDQSDVGDTGRNCVPGTVDSPVWNATDAAYNNQPTLGPFNVLGSGFTDDCRLKTGVWNANYTHYTMFVVGHGNGMYTYKTDLDMNRIQGSGAMLFYYAAGSVLSGYNFTMAGAAPNVLGVEVNGASSKTYQNNLTTPDTTGTATGTLGNAALELGSHGSALSNGVLRIAEVIVYDGALTAGELTDLRDYLNTRYGLALP